MPIHKNALWGAIGLLMVQPLFTQGAHMPSKVAKFRHTTRR